MRKPLETEERGNPDLIYFRHGTVTELVIKDGEKVYQWQIKESRLPRLIAELAGVLVKLSKIG